MRTRLAVCLAASLLTLSVASSAQGPDSADFHRGGDHARTTTPIKHVVVIFQENVSFDHYFGTYPYAQNMPGEPAFYPAPFTPRVNGFTPQLLSNNPNAANAGNGTGAINPFRLSPAQAATADQDHDYQPEQQAFDNDAMDLFPEYTGSGETLPGATAAEEGNGQVMAYYDGNTVTAMWHYAQHFAMSDNSYGSTFGASTQGAINLISGQTNGISDSIAAGGVEVADGQGGYTLVSDADPTDDVCSTSSGARVHMSGKNIGDLLNAKGITWGFFEGGFDLSTVNANGTTGCKRSTLSTVTQTVKADYIPHHQPFQYYSSTSNPNHVRPTSVAMIGHQGDAANHQYDINDFYAAVEAHNMPAVSFLKAPGYQDGHAGYSDPLDEQAFVTHVINFLQKQPEWRDTAVIIAYDDSDGWYDHQAAPHVNGSQSSQDALTGSGQCNARSTLAGVNSNGQPVQGRCGFGPRLPLLVISPWARQNYVDHALTDQTSITRFIEDNWLNGERLGGGSFDSVSGNINGMFDFYLPFPMNRRLFLSEKTGEPLARNW
ncbi:phospholipase C [Dyella mobilis]|uniref:Alkaline phosphatase family protein n=1 Tax=Dyella mobilis TaxID=1849582 RepID=A0ABS2KM63_9GAMM|nr:alkaline phosphatase family protein [Dyella mobilis]MBM7132034.1 alkaline phosphatase family protein [Dyella mobilis]GLQ95982.1 phospholipase C [Dyella mobilis]